MRTTTLSFLFLSLTLAFGAGSAACSSPGGGTGGSSGSGPGCRGDADCKKFEFCVAPGEHLKGGGGSCGASNCKTDSDCTPKGSAWICTDCLGALQCAPGCTSDSQCGLAETCMPDHRCVPKPCMADGDCPKGSACSTEKTCQIPYCMNETKCGTNEVCFPNGLCGIQPCAADADCKTNFRCSSKQCLRVACSDDSTCDGYCVDGKCYEEAGTCQLPPV